MRVLIADDDIMLVKTLSDMIERCGHEVCGVAFDGMRVISAYDEKRPDVVLIDFSMSPIDGADASRRILSQYPDAKIVIMSGFLSKEDLSLLDCGAVMMEPKPIEMERLKAILDDINSESSGPNLP
jgi:two-component system chemotaxis response regulator CheY